MELIIIDTSTEKSVVIHKKSSGEIVKKTLPSGYQSSKYLIKSLDINLHEVKLIGVTVGPGLMTGIRVGMATAQGLALGLGVPLVGISTFEGYASNEHVAVIDAKVRGAFVFEEGKEPYLVPLEELGRFKKIAGPHLERIHHPNKQEIEPDAKKMIEAVLRKFATKNFKLSVQY